MFGQVLGTEFLKLRRSRVPWFTLAALMVGPLGLGLFLWILREPGRAADLGLLGTKADLSGLEATWPSYEGYLVLVVGMGGMLLLAFIVAFVFGREYTEGTAKTMLVLPVERHWFVIAKLVVAAVWWLVLVGAVLAEAVAVGVTLGLPGFSARLMAKLVADTLQAAGISYLLVPAVALMTVLGRGYLAPLGFALGMLLLGNVFGHTGWAPWFPWSIVPILVGSVGKPIEGLPVGSYLVLAAIFVMGILATMWALRTTDNDQ